MLTPDFTVNTNQLIDNLKGICTSYGLGNDGNEFKITTRVFLYKFMNDKFGYEVKQLEPKLKTAESWEREIAKYSDEEYEFLLLKMSPGSAKLRRRHYLSTCTLNKIPKNLRSLLMIRSAILRLSVMTFSQSKQARAQRSRSLTNSAITSRTVRSGIVFAKR